MKKGNTIFFNKPRIRSYAAVCGSKEKEGVIGGYADITLSAEERKIGGLGILMVKKSMDAVDYTYEGGKNILTIKKSI